MKVLLISPLPELDPACGDITYTQTLLENPPEGVEYETYSQALKRGALKEHGNRRALKDAYRTRRLLQETSLTAVSHIVNRLRRAHLLFWEPYRLFSIQPGEYDLIHVHVFHARFFNLPCPLVLSCGSPQRDVYLDARKYSRQHVQVLDGIETLLGRAFRMNVNSYYLPQVARVVVYTQYFKEYLTRRKVVAANKIDVIPLYLESGTPAPQSSLPNRVGFVAKDFSAKGGDTLLKSWKTVRQTRSDAELYIVGSPPQLTQNEAAAQGITWIPYIPRETLLKQLMPSFDVFAYPTEYDCISYVMLEAMSRGLAIATSDYTSMPEVVDYGQAGLISPMKDSDALAANILHLLEPDVNAHFRCAAYARFVNTYSADAVRPLLRASYESAISQ